jgi:hypothetical protein
MPLIVSQPTAPSNVFRAYQSLIFELNIPASAGLYAPIIHAILFINGVQYKKEIPFNYLRTNGIGWDYQFDASGLLQSFFVNESSFGALGDVNLNTVIAPDLYNTSYLQKCTWFVRFDVYEFVGTDGTSVNSYNATSNTNFAFNGKATQDSIADLNLFLTLPFRFFTNAPKRQPICLLDSAFLSYFDLGVYTKQHIKVVSFDANGVVINTGYIILTTDTNRVHRLAVGAANINATLAAGWLAGLPVVVNAVVAYYEITLVDDPAGANLTLSETIRYCLASDCDCDGYAIYFLNDYGVDDVINVNNFSISYQSTSEFFEKINTSFPRTYTRGNLTLKPIGQQTINLVVPIANNFEWIREMANSPYIRLQKRGTNEYIDVNIVGNSDNDLSNSRGQIREVEYKFQRSNKDFSQRN